MTTLRTETTSKKEKVFTEADRKAAIEKFDYVLKNGHQSLRFDLREHVLYMLSLWEPQLKEEMAARRHLPAGKMPGFGLKLNAEGILKRLSPAENHDVNAFVQWQSPSKRSTSVPFSIRFSTYDFGLYLDIDGLLDDARVDNQIPFRGGVALCPFPNPKHQDPHCHRESECLYLPPGATTFGCLSCHGLTPDQVIGYWDSLVVTVNRAVTHQEYHDDLSSTLQKNYANSARLHLGISDLLESGLFGRKQTVGVLGFRTMSMALYEKTRLQIGYTATPRRGAARQWVLTLNGKIFGEEINTSIEVSEKHRRRGRGVEVIRTCVCPNLIDGYACGKASEDLELLSGTGKGFCCDDCSETIESREDQQKRMVMFSESDKEKRARELVAEELEAK